MKYITSCRNAIFKKLVGLDESSKKRRVSGLTILDGVHLVNSYYEKIGSPKCLFINESGHKNPEIKNLLNLEGINPLNFSRKLISATTTETYDSLSREHAFAE